MKNKIKRFFNNRIYRVIPFIVLLVVIMSIFCSPAVAYAETVSSYEDTNVWDDLTAEGTQIAGVDFDIEDYPWNENGRPQIIDLVEFGYSYFSDEQDDYGLYIYLYNPSCLQFDENSNYNKVQMTWGSYGQYKKFRLEFLNYSTAAGYEGLFWKFKINISNTISESNFLKYLSNSARTYTISGIELSINGEITEYAASSYKTTEAVYDYDVDSNTVSVGSTSLYDSSDETEYDSDSNLLVTYTYSGYALGYGSSYQTESSLVCSVDNYVNYLSLDVHQTTYRENGDYYYGLQSQVNSCYFSISNSYLENYGALTAVLAEWYEYLTKPVLVTEGYEYYSAIQSILFGRSFVNESIYEQYYNGLIDITEVQQNQNINDGYDYLFICLGEMVEAIWGMVSATGSNIWTGTKPDMGVSNLGNYAIYNKSFWSADYLSLFLANYFTSYAGAIYTGDNVSINDCNVTGSDLANVLKTNSKSLSALGYDLDILDTYCSYLFEGYVENTFGNEDFSSTPHTYGYNCLSVNDSDYINKYSNTNYQTFWQQLIGATTSGTAWSSVKALQEVDYSTYTSCKNNGSVSSTYCVNSNDLDEFDSVVQYANSHDETVFVLHYGSSSYFSYYTSQAKSTASSGVTDRLMDQIYNNCSSDTVTAYTIQETVYLNFDIISLTFTAEDGSETVVPVVMSPQEVISDLDRPLEVNTGSSVDWKTILKIFLILMLVIILCVLCAPVIPYIIQVVLWVVTAPFKLIAGIYKGIKNSVNKNKRE